MLEMATSHIRAMRYHLHGLQTSDNVGECARIKIAKGLEAASTKHCGTIPKRIDPAQILEPLSGAPCIR